MTGSYNRDVSIRKALRKRRIAKSYSLFSDSGWYDNLHQYSKNKIFCSCPMCSSKTRRDGWKHSDKVRIQKMKDRLKEYNR